MQRGMNSNEMQKNNRLLVLRTLLREGSMTRTQLAAYLNLQKATMTNIINDFFEMGIVEIDGDAAAGRRGEKIRLCMDQVFIMSIGVTRKDYQFSVFTLYGKTVRHIRCPFSKTEDMAEVLKRIKADGQLLLEEFGTDRVIGVCLAVPGLFINRPERKEEIFMVSEFEQLSRVDLHGELERALGKKILIKHDAKLSAYAEWRCAREVQNIERASMAVIRSRGYGIGVGFIVNGKIMNGHLGLAGEVGYVGINYNESGRGGSRAGTLEYQAGTESVTRYVRERLFDFPESPLKENSTYGEVLEAYYRRDPLAVWAIGKMAWMLGYGIANIIYTVNPDCIIIGPDYPENAEFLKMVRDSIRKCVPPYVEECTTIRYSELSDDSFMLGGYYYTLETLCEKEDIFALIRKALG
ncbi:MAG: ROK family protein [Lachnospiraceae bacterium]|nr:ROK family protein [Lachnospiraceae bacterium]